MERGWILDDTYYTGDDGVMRTGWQKLIPPDEYDEEINKVVPGYDTGNVEYGEDGCYWFYFGTNGKKYVPSDDNSGDDYGTRKIDGTYYCFDEDGILQIGWKDVRDNEDGGIQDYMYFGSDGKARIAGIPSSRRRIWTDMTAMWNGFIFPITESQRRQIRIVWIHRI